MTTYPLIVLGKGLTMVWSQQSAKALKMYESFCNKSW